ncbi:flagellar hook-basal body complex protein, partial [Xanthomonas citri]
MDKALYVAMTGARASLQAQGTVSHNLANVDTVGFKAALANTEAFKIQGKGYPSRIDALHVDQGFDRSQGHQKVTGNPLDVSLQQDRWLAVQSPDGSEAYTRNGELALTANGQLVTA